MRESSPWSDWSEWFEWIEGIEVMIGMNRLNRDQSCLKKVPKQHQRGNKMKPKLSRMRFWDVPKAKNTPRRDRKPSSGTLTPIFLTKMRPEASQPPTKLGPKLSKNNRKNQHQKSIPILVNMKHDFYHFSKSILLALPDLRNSIPESVIPVI